jgi:hypothetical protein
VIKRTTSPTFLQILLLFAAASPGLGTRLGVLGSGWERAVCFGLWSKYVISNFNMFIKFFISTHL